MRTACECSPATAAEWQTFLGWAAAEGWRVPQREVELFLQERIGSAWGLREGGRLSGFITCVAHQRSGWIGNLLVPAHLRGAGRGQQLFAHALRRLEDAGCRHCWLTASALGRPLYERAGFVPVGMTQRWIRPPAPFASVGQPRPAHCEPLERDRQVWGEARGALLTALAQTGTWCGSGAAVLLLQSAADLQLLGPWHRGLHGIREAAAVLEQALLLASPRQELVCDLLEGADEAHLLAAAGFARGGANLLMVRGGVGPARLEEMIAFATLGSCG